ncbi:hypothetical protein [Microseira wollei]|uniref:hypothetical protein n=1 Tax=Microseira wollei TaxID=467598 RepID=UPI001CFEBC32|nr:hypothetical protein [Microseira wollei]
MGKETGLGLTICLPSPLAFPSQIVVEKHGGAIDVMSVIGKGTDMMSGRLPLVTGTKTRHCHHGTNRY